MLGAPGAFLKAHRGIHYIYPPLLFVSFITMQAITLCTLASLKPSKKKIRRNLMLFLQTAAIATYVAEAVLMLAQSLVQKDYFSSEDSILYVLSSIVAWGVIELCLVDNSSPVWYPYYGSWVLSLVAELCLLALPNEDPGRGTGFHKAKLFVEIIRISFLFALPISFWGFQKGDNPKGPREDEESAGLLAAGNGTTGITNDTSYGATSARSNNSSRIAELEEAKVRMMKKIEESENCWVYAKSFSIFWKYIWPGGERRLQMSMVMVGVCLLAERGLNALVPHQLGVVTNALSVGNGNMPWFQVSLYVAFRWLDSGSGVYALQRYFWIPVDQYSYRSLTTAAYNHVMSLSHDFHINKKSVEIYSSVRQGRSVNGFIESLLFAVLPMLADLCIAFAYFYYMFDAYMALLVAVVAIVYLYSTAKLGAMKNQIRRDFNNTMIDETSVMCETMSSWATVSYFNRVEYEQDRYLGAITNFQQAERNYIRGISLLNVVQGLIFTVGLLGASFLAVYEVSIGSKPVGSFVSLLSYWAQLGSPLSFFSNFYRKVQTQMLDAERLLELLQKKPSVIDKPEAKGFQIKSGEIEFVDVCFSYDPRKPAIKNMSFRAPGGSKVALVGETGGGKSTCLKLLFRFYDVTSGSINIDGQDLRDVTLLSLRENMGVVPQDPQLFNDTLMMNLKYANFGATDEEVYAACRAAAIHEKILSFPDGYLTKVGEHGVKLSGGELQRVAIARAILKNSKIILLDEATSMVDMETERLIQSAFHELASNRTMFVIAHRLSTIMNADLIIVIKDGEIVEKGSHDELIEAGGKYFQLWSKQLRNQDPKSPSGSPAGLNVVNDLSPKSREQELKKVLGEADSLFHLKSKLEDKSETDRVTLITNPPPISIPTAKDGGGIESNSQGRLDTDKISKSANIQRNFVTFAPEIPRSSLQSEVKTPSAQGILKSSGSAKNAEKHRQLSRPVTPRTPSSLKPDAQEFIPNEFTSKGFTSHSISYGPSVGSYAGGPSKLRGPGDEVISSVVADISAFSDPSENDKPKKEGNTHDQDRTQVGRIQALQEKIGRALKSSEAKVKEMKEGKASEMVPTEDKSLGATRASKISVSVPSGGDGGHECAVDSENSPISPTECHSELQSEQKKKRRRNRRRSNKSKSTDEIDAVVADGYREKTPEMSLNESPSLHSMKNISPRPCGEELPPTLDGDSSINKKQKRHSPNGSKTPNPKAGMDRAAGSLLSLRDTVSGEELSKQYNGKNKLSSAGESNYHAILKAGDDEHMIGSSKAAEPTTPTSSITNRNTLRDQGRRKSWGKSTALKGSWGRSGKDDRDESTDVVQNKGLTDGASVRNY